MKNELLKVLIVDDEYLIRELLKKRVDWESIDCEITDEASCASEVFDILEEKAIDLIITDINMPKTDGLEMSKLILESYPKIKIMVLTGYDKFEYAKSGIEMGIVDYILKPIQKDKIEEAVLNVKKAIKKERDKEFEYDFVKEKLQENLPYLQERFFIELLNKRIAKEEIEEKIKFLQLRVDTNLRVQIVVIELELSMQNKPSEEKRLINLLSVKKLIDEHYKGIGNIYTVLDSKQHITICHIGDEVGNLYDEYNDLLKVIRSNSMSNINIGIGSSKLNIEYIKESYEEALLANRYKTILGNNTVICYKDLDIVSSDNTVLSPIKEEEIEQLQFLIKAGLKENAIDYLDTLLDHMVQKSEFENKLFIEYVRVQITRIVSMSLYMISSMNIKVESIIGDEDNYFKQLTDIKTIPGAKRILDTLITRMVDCINGMQKHMVNDYMKDVEEYIKNNIGNYGLTLKKVASNFYLNPSYLCRIFKQKVGISFKEYVNKIRIEKAVEYIRSTDMKVYEIGEQIGIPDANYFSAIFKKNMGMSITSYKKMIKKS